ncbi:hypothetical protein D3C84_1193080 [compost metagenome]
MCYSCEMLAAFCLISSIMMLAMITALRTVMKAESKSSPISMPWLSMVRHMLRMSMIVKMALTDSP